MIKKIICPTDFSPTADNALAYAAKMCKVSGAELEVFHIRTPRLFEAVLAGTSAIEKTKYVSNTLNTICNDANKSFHITCSSHIETSGKFLEYAITSAITDNTIIVMGTNGADDLFQRIFGSNTFNLLHLAQCPVLIIPDDVSYGTIQGIMLAWDQKFSGKKVINQMKEWIELFKPEINLLQVNYENTQKNRDLYIELNNEMNELLKNKNSKVNHKKIFPDNVIDSIEDQMQKTGATLLALIFHEKGPMNILAGNKIIRKIIDSAKYPVLVLHEKE